MGSPVFRVTTYDLVDADWSGATALIQLKKTLSANYFVMCEFGSTSNLPSVGGWRVKADPYGTGDLSTTDGNQIQIEVDGPTLSGVRAGALHVVECLRDSTGAGFRLLDVVATDLADNAAGGVQSTTDTSSTAWDRIESVVLFGGLRGGGISSATATAAGDQTTFGVRIYPSSTATLNFQRYGYGTSDCEAATITTYVVEFGREWDVQRVNVTGNAGGSGIDASWEYDTGALDRTVTRANTWLWAVGYTQGSGSGASHLAISVALGDGAAENSTESTVAVGGWFTTTRSTEVYALSHPSLSNDWQFGATIGAGSRTYDFTVPSPSQSEAYGSSDSIYLTSVLGSRLPIAYGGIGTTSSTYFPEIWTSCRYTDATTLQLTRADDGTITYGWAGWVQSVDFGAVQTDVGSEPVFRVTTVEVGPGDFSTTTHDIELPHDIERDYFVILNGMRGDAATSSAREMGCRVTADPFGTGGLAVSSGSNVIQLTKPDIGSYEWEGAVIVVECLRSSGEHGFKLIDVTDGSLANSGSSVNGTEVTASSSWTDPERVMIVAGLQGAGASLDSANGTADYDSTCLLCRVAGDSLDTYTVRRVGASASYMEDASFTAYIVQWGSAWDLDVYELVQETATGSYTEFDLGKTYTTSKTALFATYNTAEAPQFGRVGPSLVPGDGVTQGATFGSLAVKTYVAGSIATVAYLLTHSSLSVEWDAVSGSTLDASDTFVLSDTRGESYGNNGAEDYTVGSRYCTPFIRANSSGYTTAPQTFFRVRPNGPNSATATRAQTGIAWDGWVETVDFGSIQAVTEADPADSDDDARGPVQYLILQDAWWTGVASSATSEGGAYAGPLVPMSTNLGSLAGFQDGTPDSDAVDLDFKIVKTGSVASRNAGVVAKRSSEATSLWRGLNMPNTQMQHDSIASQAMYASTVAYSSVYRRILVMYLEDSTTLQIKYRDQDEKNRGQWSSTTLTVENADDGTSNYGDTGLDCVELPDGRLLLCLQVTVPYTLSGVLTTYYYSDWYASEDGGLTWERVHHLLEDEQSIYPGSSPSGGWLMATSGDYIRLVRFVSTQDKASGTLDLYTYVSTDRGSSWALVNSSPSTTVTPRGGTGANSGYGSWVFSLEGCGDQSGTFLLLVGDGASGESSAVYIASGTDDWVAYTDLDIDWTGELASARPHAQTMYRHGRTIYLWTLLENSGLTAGGWYLYTIDAADPQDTDSWTSHGRVSVLGAPDYGPYRLKGVWCGDHAMLHGAIVDYTTTSGDNFVDGCMCSAIGQWDTRPWAYSQGPLDWFYTRWNAAGAGDGTGAAWWAWMGDPTTIGGTLWTNPSTGTASWTAAEMAHSAGSGLYSYSRYNGGAPAAFPGGLSDLWSIDAWHFVFRIDSAKAGSDPASNEDMGFRLINRTTATNGIDVSIRLGNGRVVIYDNHGATIVDNTAVTEDFSSDTEVRVAVAGARVSVMIREIGSGETWTEAGTGATSTAATSGQEFQIGVIGSLVSAGTSECAFSEVFKSYQTFHNTMGQEYNGTTYPDDIAGAEVSADRVHVLDGVSVKFGGGGPMSGDEFTGEIDHTRGLENLAFDSPSLMWESTGLGSNSLVFRAGSTGSQRWEMDALLLVGTVDRTCVLEFANADSWSSPAESFTLSADLYTDLTVVAVDGASFKVQAGSGSYLPSKRGEIRGMFVRFVAAGSATGTTLQIKADPDKGNGWFQVDDGQDLATLGIGAGAAAVFYGDRMVFRSDSFKRYQYFRLTFPDVSSVASSLGTSTGTHRLGSMVPGFRVEFSVPLDWAFTDNEQPNATEYAAKSGVDWVHTEGESQRVVSARIVGDITEFRRELRLMLDKYHDFSRRPAGLVLDSQHMERGTVMLGRWKSGLQEDEAGWKQDERGEWRPIGDAAFTMTEVV